jgi:hypothetical protein
VTRSQWYQAVTTTAAPLKQIRQKAPDSLTVIANKITRPFHYLIFDPLKKYVGGALRKPYNQTATAYTRFMSAQIMQKLIVLLAVLVVAPLFWKVISFREEDVASLEELQDWRAGKNPEDEYGYVIDGEAIPFNGESKGVPKQYPISSKVKAAPADEEVATINLSGGDDEEDETPPPKKTAPVKKSVPAVAKTATSVAKTIAGDACSLVKNKSGWILQESAFSTKDAAAARVAALGKKNISARALAQSCITSGKTGWIVWLGNIQSSEAAARTAAASQQKTLRSAGFAGAKVLLKPLK